MHKGMQLATGFWPLEQTLGEVDKEMLSSPFSEKDVVSAIMSMKVESAPSPNELTVTFFRKFWRYPKKDFMQMVQDFNRNRLNLKRLNYCVITLVPKVKEANTVRQYKPIFLLNVDFKIFSKLLTDRITPLANGLISDSQSAFIKGRNILEGVVVLHEVLDEFRRSGQQGVLFKIDFEKAYDKVRWNFVSKVLWEKGFPETWIHQVMSTVQGGQVCVNVNGERTQYFKNIKA
jgi:hypothetical protein